jgi:hypothetical protein
MHHDFAMMPLMAMQIMPSSLTSTTMMRLLCVCGYLTMLAAATPPSRQPWIVIPRGGSDYEGKLEVVKSTVLESSAQSVSVFTFSFVALDACLT